MSICTGKQSIILTISFPKNVNEIVLNLKTSHFGHCGATCSICTFSVKMIAEFWLGFVNNAHMISKLFTIPSMTHFVSYCSPAVQTQMNTWNDWLYTGLVLSSIMFTFKVSLCCEGPSDRFGSFDQKVALIVAGKMSLENSVTF